MGHEKGDQEQRYIHKSVTKQELKKNFLIYLMYKLESISAHMKICNCETK